MTNLLENYTLSKHFSEKKCQHVDNYIMESFNSRYTWYTGKDDDVMTSIKEQVPSTPINWYTCSNNSSSNLLNPHVDEIWKKPHTKTSVDLLSKSFSKFSIIEQYPQKQKFAIEDKIMQSYNDSQKTPSSIFRGSPSKHGDYFNMKSLNGVILSNLASRMNVNIINNIDNCKRFMNHIRRWGYLGPNRYLTKEEYYLVCAQYNMSTKRNQNSVERFTNLQNQSQINKKCLYEDVDLFNWREICYRYKTELCIKYFSEGVCKYQEKCQFAHGYHELNQVPRHKNYKTQSCKSFHDLGFCPYGSRCNFVHNEGERKSQQIFFNGQYNVSSESASTSSSLECGFQNV